MLQIYTISIHAPTREATVFTHSFKTLQTKFQSTLPQGKRRKSHHISNQSILISIHAPTREATFFKLSTNISATISIHAPTREATVLTHSFETLQTEFQSTLPQGKRLPHVIRLCTHCTISIHAPTREATWVVVIQIFYTLISIHAPTREATAFFSTFLLF